jgi:DNA invertase Pin-like site-specific DNA recombinase
MRGSLGHFLEAIRLNQVEPASVLIVESLDRLSREPPLQALDQMRGILHAGVDIVTLTDGQRYSKSKLGQLDALLVPAGRVGPYEQRLRRITAEKRTGP